MGSVDGAGPPVGSSGVVSDPGVRCADLDGIERDVRGDLLAVFSAGAYGMVMASTYNAHPLPAEVLVRGEEARQARARQSVADLIEPELRERP